MSTAPVASPRHDKAARVLVLGCWVLADSDSQAQRAAAYTTTLIRAAEADGRPWLICSAEHGLVTPGRGLPWPGRSHVPADSGELGALIATQHATLAAAGGPDPGVEAWAPAGYVAALRAGGVDVTRAPLVGLDVAATLRWLTRHAGDCRVRDGHPSQYGLVYVGSLTAHRGQHVVDAADGAWIDDGSLLGVQLLDVTLTSGVHLRNVAPNHLTLAWPAGEAPPRLTQASSHSSTRPPRAAVRTTPTATRGRGLT